MKVIAVLGSPREQSYSTTLAREVLRGAADAGYQVVVYEINRMDVKGCQGCRYCKDNDADCNLEDDLQPYWKDLHESGHLQPMVQSGGATIAGNTASADFFHLTLDGANAALQNSESLDPEDFGG